uniref:Methyltransferase domain-containing protein n=1 Tax=Sinocyclocheilus grahami TaxID=75366 RepID=A0A672S6Q1_SINGR
MIKFFKWHNQILEENAVKLCNKQPNDMVLEIGHGLGLGLQAASQLLTDPEGKLQGVDYFQYMHEIASKHMKEQISRGKAVLYKPNSKKVFHCICYYFWPDLKAGARAIHRVMKPDEISRILGSVIKAANMKVLTGDKWHPEVYREVSHCLENSRKHLFNIQLRLDELKKSHRISD